MLELEFSKNLRDWYRNNGRKLPWRETSDPYKIWLSEIILQQTRVDQGLPYYINFVESFPTIGDFAKAPIDKILRLWQGLGYYSRARNMHTAALQVVQQFDGRFPADFESLKNLKGVGDYTASAIASFAFHLPHPVVDGNVFRFLSRLSGSAVPIDSSLGKKVFAEMAGELFDPKHAAEHNQAMMEMGALICKPKAPLCEECPFHMACHAYIYNEIDRLPVKEKRAKVRTRYFHYFFFTHGSDTFISRRNKKDIWEGLYELPLFEADREDIDIQHIQLPFKLSIAGNQIDGRPSRFRHLLSHQELIVHFWKIKLNTGIKPRGELRSIPLHRLREFAFPQVIIKFLKQEDLV
ncbi:MAG: A/G-specific adenine glycosylase [Bacteroidetes bacterium]|jgi:A/G-specific adenine glycosylase|nr:A/G-specific adenine glycosylase [Bacteroidota bacterium]